MQRTQVYLDEQQVAQLKSVARAAQRTMSDIIREAIDEKLNSPAKPDEFERALAAAAGVWADRKDLGATDEYVRRVRQDRRGAPPG